MTEQSGGADILDARELIPPGTEAAFLAISVSDTGKFFADDVTAMAAECAAFTAAPAEWQPSTREDLLLAHHTRGESLAEQVFLHAWAAGLSDAQARDFASVIGYLAGLAVVEGHCAAGTCDREFVEAASWEFEFCFHWRFREVLARSVLDAPRSVH